MTIKQKQCLLEYLGYYKPENSGKVNNVDGELGPKTEAATKAFQQDYGLEADGIFGPLTEKEILDVIATGRKPGVNWKEIKHFGRAEFMCNCGGKYCNGFPVEPVPLLVKTADKVRDHFGKASIVSSGVRCKQHNANVGGVANSRHLEGRAMDFRISGKKAAEVLEYVWTLPGVRYAYDIDGTYVHMDVK
jgi:hypothetical protein